MTTTSRPDPATSINRNVLTGSSYVAAVFDLNCCIYGDPLYYSWFGSGRHWLLISTLPLLRMGLQARWEGAVGYIPPISTPV